jgi:hypothetical protein
MSAAFDSHALAALRLHPCAWHCMPCWTREVGLHSPEEVAQLRLLARRLRFSREHELKRAGFGDGHALPGLEAVCEFVSQLDGRG